jgi:hypothetical protein
MGGVLDGRHCKDWGFDPGALSPHYRVTPEGNPGVHPLSEQALRRQQINQSLVPSKLRSASPQRAWGITQMSVYMRTLCPGRSSFPSPSS